MKINLMDGGMIFEINKIYKDYGEYAFDNDNELINNLYENYIKIGCRFITTSNYCFKPKYIKNWEKYTIKSVEILQKFRNESVNVMGSIPPFNKSYEYNIIDKDFIDYYEKLINILKNKVDFYIIETGYNYKEIIKIYKIIKSIDPYTRIIISIYPNINHVNYIKNYLDLDIYGLFLNCANFMEIKNFHKNYLENKNFNDKIFGFYCNNIDEKKYSKDYKIIVSDKMNPSLEKYELNFSLDEDDIISFINNLKYKEIFIGGCCGFGIREMEKLFNILKKIKN